MDWNEKEIKDLQTLKIKGYSASQIAKQLGCTRNAVIGKLHRLADKGIGKTVPLVRKPYLSELSYSSWSSPRYKE